MDTDKLVETLGISIKEAEDLMAQDAAIDKAKDATIENFSPVQGERKKESKKRATTKNQERIDIINLLADALSAQGYAPSIANAERIIDFGDYSISLTKHKK